MAGAKLKWKFKSFLKHFNVYKTIFGADLAPSAGLSRLLLFLSLCSVVPSLLWTGVMCCSKVRVSTAQAIPKLSFMKMLIIRQEVSDLDMITFTFYTGQCLWPRQKPGMVSCYLGMVSSVINMWSCIFYQITKKKKKKNWGLRGPLEVQALYNYLFINV